MEIMRLTTNNRIYNIFSDNINTENPKIYGYIYENNHFSPLNEDVFKELNKLRIGNNTKKIGDYESDNHVYDVILDLDTNLKHYFLSGKEDYSLFINNFEDVIITDNDSNNTDDNKNNKKNKKKLILLAPQILAIGLQLTLLINRDNYDFIWWMNSLDRNLIDNIDLVKSKIISEQMENTKELTLETFKQAVNSNKNIEDNDREILFNDEFLEFVIPYINKNEEHANKLANIILPNFEINDGRCDKNIVGTWDYLNRKITLDNVKIENYNKEFDRNYYVEVLSHEWVHALQSPDCKYNFFIEGCAEMISSEYLGVGWGTSYYSEQNRIKMLMEIIGSDSIIEYTFTGNIDPMKKELEKYLSESDIEQLFNLFKLSSSYIDKNLISSEQFNQNLQDIDKILQKLYYNKYNQSIETNYVISKYMNSEYNTFDKYYFNDSAKEADDGKAYLFYFNNYKLQKNRETIRYRYSIQTMLKSLIDNLNMETIKQTFNNNQNLSNAEKQVLFNEEFINDYIKYKSEYYDEIMNESGNIPVFGLVDIDYYLEHLKIIRKDETAITGETDSLVEDSNDFIRKISTSDLLHGEIIVDETNCYQYSYINNLLYGDVYQKELIEQFVRAFSTSKECNYNNILNSACTNIILKEYYGIELPKKDSISMFEEKATKILMDLIGSEPLKYYYFTGDNKLIREKLGQISDTDVNEVMMALEQSITDYFDIDFKVYQDLDMHLCNLYNNKNNTQYPYSNFVNNYYIPETKGYFSKSYIEIDKISHPENYSNISFEENNDLGKSR